MGRRSESSDDDSTYRSEEESEFEEEARKEKKSKEKKSVACASRGKNHQAAPPTPSRSKIVKASEKPPPRPRKRKIDDRDFDELQVTHDMTESLTNYKRVKLSSSLMVENKIIEVKDDDTKKTYSYPAIVFLRRTKDGKVFEFNVPTNLAMKLVEAVQVIALR